MTPDASHRGGTTRLARRAVPRTAPRSRREPTPRPDSPGTCGCLRDPPSYRAECGYLTRLTVWSRGGSLLRHSSSVMRFAEQTAVTRRRFPILPCRIGHLSDRPVSTKRLRPHSQIRREGETGGEVLNPNL